MPYQLSTYGTGADVGPVMEDGGAAPGAASVTGQLVGGWVFAQGLGKSTEGVRWPLVGVVEDVAAGAEATDVVAWGAPAVHAEALRRTRLDLELRVVRSVSLTALHSGPCDEGQRGCA